MINLKFLFVKDMEIIDKESIDSPLLVNVEDEIYDSDYIIDNIKCYQYKTKNGHSVKVVANNDKIIPNTHTFNRNKKQWITGDYLVVVMLDVLKKMKDENKKINSELNRLRNEIKNIKNQA